MKEIIILFLLVVAQNASFTLVSRARNSNSLLYHTLAAIGSNGIWLLVFRNMVVSINDATLMWTYLVASVLGSIGMHYLAMKFFEKRKEVRQQVPTVGRIVNYNYAKGELFGTLYTCPAIITNVIWTEDKSRCLVCLNVFNPYEGSSIHNDVAQGNELYQWNWPEIKK